jgi:hypothetical protein
VHGIVEPDVTQANFISGLHYGYGGEIGSDETEGRQADMGRRDRKKPGPPAPAP